MQTALNIAMIIVSVVLISLILLQTKGSSFSGAFGGDAGSINRTRRGVEKTLFQVHHRQPPGLHGSGHRQQFPGLRHGRSVVRFSGGPILCGVLSNAGSDALLWQEELACLGLGWQELVIVLVIIMIIFGAGKLPEVAKSLGQGVKEFKQESAADRQPGCRLRFEW